MTVLFCLFFSHIHIFIFFVDSHTLVLKEKLFGGMGGLVFFVGSVFLIVYVCKLKCKKMPKQRRSRGNIYTGPRPRARATNAAEPDSLEGDSVGGGEDEYEEIAMDDQYGANL